MPTVALAMQNKTTPVCKGALLALLCSSLPTLGAAKTAKSDEILESFAHEIRDHHLLEVEDAKHVIAGLLIMRDRGNRNVILPAWASMTNLMESMTDSEVIYYAKANEVRADRARKQITLEEVQWAIAESAESKKEEKEPRVETQLLFDWLKAS